MGNRTVIINASAPLYNLACEKIKRWQENIGNNAVILRTDNIGTAPIECLVADSLYISVIRSYDTPKAISLLNWARDHNIYSEVGGPGTVFLAEHIENETGVVPVTSVDPRFERVLDGEETRYTFTTRGCIWGCPFCVVKELEGRDIHVYNTFPFSPMVGDNNLLLSPDWHINRVIRRLTNRYKSIDLNSGIDCRIFATDPEKYYSMLKKGNLKRWYFAWDSENQTKPIQETLAFMSKHYKKAGTFRSKVFVYILCNHPSCSPDEIEAKARKIISIGAAPYLMEYLPLDSLRRHYVAPNWVGVDINSLKAYYNTPSRWSQGDMDLIERE